MWTTILQRPFSLTIRTFPAAFFSLSPGGGQLLLFLKWTVEVICEGPLFATATETPIERAINAPTSIAIRLLVSLFIGTAPPSIRTSRHLTLRHHEDVGNLRGGCRRVRGRRTTEQPSGLRCWP